MEFMTPLRRQRRHIWLAATAMLTWNVAPAFADTAPAIQAAQAATFTFDIPAKSLDQALADLGTVTGLRLIYTAELPAGTKTAPLQGSMTAEAALQRLLAGSGFTFQFTNATTVTLIVAPADGTTLTPLTVEDSYQAESAYGPVEGYKAGQASTATKTDTPIMEVPGSVQVVPRDVIEDQGALNLKDVYENVSGVQQSGNTLNAQSEVLPVIRGFESPTLLRNGLRSTQVGSVDLVNVERVEVLKGPASILYGSLEPGGIINYVTKKPQAEAAYSLTQQAGSEDTYRTAADVTGPLVEDDSLLYRLNLAYTNSDSFRDDIDLERVAVAPSFLWAPTERTELLLDFSFLQEKQPYDTGIPLDSNGSALVSRDTFFGDPDLDGRNIHDYVASYQLTHEFNDVFSLRNQFQFHRAEADNEALRPRGVGGVPGAETLLLRYQNEERQDDEFQFVLDGTAKFATGFMDHSVLLGAELLAQDSDFRRFRQNIPSVAISDDADVDFSPPDNQPKSVTLGKSRRAGFYLQDQISLLEDGQLKLLLGGRYDLVHTENEVDGVSSPNVNDDAFSGRAGLLYEFADQYSAYVSVSQSFDPQNPGTLDANGVPLDPEEGLQYETGLKGSFLDDRLLATVSVFQIEKTNVAVTDLALFNATGQIASLPGIKQRSRGVELDVSGAITDELQIIARHKARLWLNYEFAEDTSLEGLGLGAGIRYVGESTAQFNTDLKLDPYVVVDAAVWYEWQALKVGFNAYNLFNENYIVRASDQSIAHPGAPFTVLGSASLKF